MVGVVSVGSVGEALMTAAYGGGACLPQAAAAGAAVLPLVSWATLASPAGPRGQ